MASLKRNSMSVTFSVLLLYIIKPTSSNLVLVNDGNWNQTMKGEWMINFYSSRCSSCQIFQIVWEDFASKSSDLGIQVGQVDISREHKLKGRFMISDVPTIFHVKEGVFRQYKGPPKNDFVSYIKEKKWEAVKPLSRWEYPSSFLMSLMGQINNIKGQIVEKMNVLLNQYGILFWATILFVSVFTMMMCRWFLSQKQITPDAVDDSVEKNMEEKPVGESKPASEGETGREEKSDEQTSLITDDEDPSLITDDEDPAQITNDEDPSQITDDQEPSQLIDDGQSPQNRNDGYSVLITDDEDDE